MTFSANLLLTSVFAALLLAGGFVLLRMQERGPPADSAMLLPVEAGRLLAKEKSCVACHSQDGSIGLGPSWKDSYGSVRVFSDGTMLTIDEAYLRESMRNPAAKIVRGFENLMLPVDLNDSQINDIIALIKALATQTTQTSVMTSGNPE